MRFRESPPPPIPTDHLVLHPASSNLYSHKVLASVHVGESIDLVRVSSFILLHQYPLPACLFASVASVLAATLCQSSFSLGPRPPTSGLSTCNKGGWTPILLCCTPAVQHSNGYAIEPAATVEGAAASFAQVEMLAALGHDSAAGATTEQRQHGDSGGGACFLAQRRRPRASFASGMPLVDGLER